MLTVLESLNQALHQLMAADDRVMVLGEDILDPYGGAFKVTKGLSSKFPDRVFTTPISEAAIVGLASGLALRGLCPIAEVMFGDFLFLAGDQLVNHAAKFQWMYNDKVRVPFVLRAPMGARRGYGPTHSQSIEKHFMGVPGLWLVAPHVLSSPGDLLRQAVMDCDAPVVFIESKTCYGRPLVANVPKMTATVITDDASPFPTTLLRHDRPCNPDGLLWCYGGMVPHCLDALQRLRDVEGLFIDLAVVSQLSPVPSAHVRRVLDAANTSVFIYAEEASVEHGWSAEMLAQVQQHATAASRLPQAALAAVTHARIGASYTPIPSSRELERAALPQVDDIVRRVLELF
jgi:pyruvate/2-oxoglutarate/acetoin dehydrogenase E1 component